MNLSRSVSGALALFGVEKLNGSLEVPILVQTRLRPKQTEVLKSTRPSARWVRGRRVKGRRVRGRRASKRPAPLFEKSDGCSLGRPSAAGSRPLTAARAGAGATIPPPRSSSPASRRRFRRISSSISTRRGGRATRRSIIAAG